MKKTFRIQLTTTLIAGALVLAASVAHAGDIKQLRATLSNPSESWSTPDVWENNEAPSSSNNYFTNGWSLRSTTVNGGNGTATFTGASLTVDGPNGGNGGTLTMKSKTVSIGNLLLSGGSLVTNNVNTGSNQPATLNVTNLTILGSATVSAPATLQGSNTNNDLTVNITNLKGNGYLQFTNPRNYSLSVTDASAFTGTLHHNQGTLTLSSDFNASSATFSMSASGASLTLSNNITVSSFTFGSTTLDVSGSTYTSAQLNTLFNKTVFSGSGILTIASVVPEPSTLALLAGGAVLAICGATRFRTRFSKRS